MATSSEGIDVLDMKHYQFMACLSNMQGHLQQAASITTQQLTVHSYIDWWWSFKPTNGRCVQIDIHEIRDAASRMWYHLKEESSFEEMLRRLRESKEDEVIIEITNDLPVIFSHVKVHRSDYEITAAHSHLFKREIWPTYFQLRPAARMRDAGRRKALDLGHYDCLSYQPFRLVHGSKEFDKSNPDLFKLEPFWSTWPIEAAGQQTQELLTRGIRLPPLPLQSLWSPVLTVSTPATTVPNTPIAQKPKKEIVLNTRPASTLDSRFTVEFDKTTKVTTRSDVSFVRHAQQVRVTSRDAGSDFGFQLDHA